MKNFEIIIIGGGASGLFFASHINNKSVLILEKADKIGKKILATGNGRCNLSNTNINNQFYVGDDISPFLSLKESKNILPYFNNLGLTTYSDSEGRIYPTSNMASSVLDVLRLNIENKSNITINTNEEVVKIEQQNDGYIITTLKEKYFSKYVVFAACSNTTLLDNFNLEKAPFCPALCSFKTSKNKGLNGVKVSGVKVKLIQDNTEFIESGEVLFKDNALSGICVFNLSLHYLLNSEAQLVIDLAPNLSLIDLKNYLSTRKENLQNYKMDNFFTGFFHKNLSLNILEKASILPSEKISELTEKQLDKLSYTIKNYSLKVIGLENNNQIYKGGIYIKNLTNNLECKNYKNLFILGEALNVQGICGGYNLHWAFLSALIAANYINKN